MSRKIYKKTMPIKQKKKVCIDCGDEHYIFSKGRCKSCSIRYNASLSKSGVVVHKDRDRAKLSTPVNSKIDFNMPEEELSSLSLSKLKRICDFWFRFYLLSRAEKDSEGKIFCIVTEKWLYPADLHVCHYKDRSVLGLRYSEDNCVLCSSQSNVWEATLPDETGEYKSVHHRKFAAGLFKKDKEKIENLELLSKNIVVYQKKDYINQIIKFKKG